MKPVSDDELKSLAGQYFAPVGLYQYTKSLPFLGTLTCNTENLFAGQWTELLVEYAVGASGLADGAWIKGTFKFYSDWALFQTSDPKADNYVSAEHTTGTLHPGQTASTVQSLAVRFDQKGHERPFQKAIIVDIVDGYMNPGDKIVVRLGDRRWGAKGTRAQTFVEKGFRMRWYIDPVGTSRFAAIKPDISIDITPGEIVSLKLVTPRVVRPGCFFPLHTHAEDAWGNTTIDQKQLRVKLDIVDVRSRQIAYRCEMPLNSDGWSVGSEEIALSDDGDYEITATLVNVTSEPVCTAAEYIAVESSLAVPRVLYADLHVHSDDTIGTNSTAYNFSYAQQIAGLDIVGYTANDFNITQERWDKTLEIIKQVNSPGSFVVFPGTEWCGNSAAGGDHNVVFLDDDPPVFPFDRHGNVVRSFEWNEDGPAELVPGAWPLDEVYATYAHAPEKNLMIPHVGGRRCNLAWHHPQLERLLEIGSAWGLFEWLLRDAVHRGWKLGVCANSDEHRGRCGGGVPGTAVFGTKGGLTGVLAEKLEKGDVAMALRARRTFATTGERLVGLVETDGGAMQGDEINVSPGEAVNFKYDLFGSKGFVSVEAWGRSGKFFHRDLQAETARTVGTEAVRKVRVRWGGARLLDRYREAVWQGSIIVSGAAIKSIWPFGGVAESPEEKVSLLSDTHVVFTTRTSGDFDGVDIFFHSKLPSSLRVTGSIGGYVKVGDPLKGNPHKAHPVFDLAATREEASQSGGKTLSIRGGADLFVDVEVIEDVSLPRRVSGKFELSTTNTAPGSLEAVYVVGREWDGGKVITSPIFINQ